MTTTRHDQVAQRLGAVRDRIEAACRAAGRDPAEVSLVVVTKTFPASDVRVLAELGVTAIGENRHQEARDKVRECADLDVHWHFVGHVQSNKAAQVAAYADVVHSVDRTRVVKGLARGAQRERRRVGCFVQVSLDPLDDRRTGSRRSGADPEEVPAVADAVAARPELDLLGVMAIAPLGEDPRSAFERLAATAERLRRHHPDANRISAGMSADLEAAIEAGATHVRVGSAILGDRPPLG